MSSKICPSCGAVVDGSKFCGVCGTEVPEEQVDRQPAATENAGQPEYSSPYERPAERVKLEKQPEPQMMVPTQAPPAMPMPSVAPVPVAPNVVGLKEKSAFTTAGQVLIFVYAGLVSLLSISICALINLGFNPAVVDTGSTTLFLSSVIASAALFALAIAAAISKGGASIIITTIIHIQPLALLFFFGFGTAIAGSSVDFNSFDLFSDTQSAIDTMGSIVGLIIFAYIGFLLSLLSLLGLIFMCIGRTKDSTYKKLFLTPNYM